MLLYSAFNCVREVRDVIGARVVTALWDKSRLDREVKLEIALRFAIAL